MKVYLLTVSHYPFSIEIIDMEVERVTEERIYFHGGRSVSREVGNLTTGMHSCYENKADAILEADRLTTLIHA